MTFLDVEHVENNYANKSMPVGGPDDPQYFDCHERTTGINVAYLATALCAALTPLYAMLDPEFGLTVWGDSREDKLRKDIAKMRAEELSKAEEARVSLDEQIESLWKWAEASKSPRDDGRRFLPRDEVTFLASAAGVDHEGMCELLKAPDRHSSDFVEVTVLREEFVERIRQQGSDRTEQMHLGLLFKTHQHLQEKADGAVLDAKIAAVWDWANILDDEALGRTELTRLADRVGYGVVLALKLQEPPSPGSPVRHRGTLGTAVTDPSGIIKVIKVRLDGKDEVDEIDVDELECDLDQAARVSKASFVETCLSNPDKTDEWFRELGLELEQRRGCLGDVCACCGWCT